MCGVDDVHTARPIKIQNIAWKVWRCAIFCEVSSADAMDESEEGVGWKKQDKEELEVYLLRA